GTGFSSFTWSTGATSQTLQVTQSGTYWVQATTATGCMARDTIVVTVLPAPSVTLAAGLTDSLGCKTISSTVSGGTPPYSYAWGSGDTSQQLRVCISGTYQLTVTGANGCSTMASVQVTLPGSCSVHLGNDTSI